MEDADQLGSEDPVGSSICLAYVAEVSGAAVRGIIREEVATSADGDPEGDALQIGALVRMHTAVSDVFGLVTSMKIEHLGLTPETRDVYTVDVQLVGEVLYTTGNDREPVFQRGVSIFPGLGSEILATTANELALVYARPETSTVRIGTVFQDQNLPAYVMTDEMLGKHFAVLGTTGTGKSCTVALLLRSILEQHPNGHAVLLDPHSEYSHAFGEAAEVVSPGDLELPYWMMNFEETVAVMVTPNSGTTENETAILKDALLEARRKFLGEHEDVGYVTVDTISPYRLVDLVRNIDNALGALDKPDNSAPYLRLLSRVETLRADQRLDFMFPHHLVYDNLAEVLARLLRIPAEGKPITILDISGLPCDIVDVVVSVLCRTIFDFAVWSERDRAQPVLLVCEEAHRYAPGDDSLAFAPTRKALARIAKEGRKYGISLCLVSQRPSELSTTILSQCNTLFALRMSNERDHEFVRNALPEAAAGLLEALPSLRTQDAIAVGEGLTVPMRLRLADLPAQFRPRSGTAYFSVAWETDSDEGFIEDTITRWRRQIRTEPGDEEHVPGRTVSGY